MASPTSQRKSISWFGLPLGSLIAIFVGSVCFQLFIYGFWAAMFSGPGFRESNGSAPDADYATRRQWGKTELVSYFDFMDKWVRKSELIREDIGKVTGVAPIGATNKYQAFFGDPANVEMNLQVIGERGEGILNLPEMALCDVYDKTSGLHPKSTWKFNGQSTYILFSGRARRVDVHAINAYAK